MRFHVSLDCPYLSRPYELDVDALDEPAAALAAARSVLRDAKGRGIACVLGELEAEEREVVVRRYATVLAEQAA